MPSLADILNAMTTITADEMSGPMIAKLVKQLQTETTHLSAKATATFPAPFAPEPGMKIPGADYLLTDARELRTARRHKDHHVSRAHVREAQDQAGAHATRTGNHRPQNQ
jgi:hypothetical protein